MPREPQAPRELQKLQDLQGLQVQRGQLRRRAPAQGSTYTGMLLILNGPLEVRHLGADAVASGANAIALGVNAQATGLRSISQGFFFKKPRPKSVLQSVRAHKPRGPRARQ